MREDLAELPCISTLLADAMPKGPSWFAKYRAVNLPTFALLAGLFSAGAGAAEQPPTIEKSIAEGSEVIG